MCKRKRVWLCCRIAGADRFSMQLQVDELRRYAAEHGYIIAGIMQEHGNGVSLNRQGLSEVIEAVENGKTDIVLVKSVSRIARHTEHLLEFIRILREYGVFLESTFSEV